MKFIFLVLALLVTSSGYSQNHIWLIGTVHQEKNYINTDSLTAALSRIKPDLILMELEDKHFTKDFKFNTEKYPLEDFLVGIENIAIYKYQQQYGTQLRPFDINGRHEFYQKENYQERENKMFSEMLNIYKNNKLSESCKVDFEILLSALSSYSELHFSSLRESNSDVATKFLALKNKINFELMLSIIKRTEGLKNWLNFAELRMEYWNRRNRAMANNIIKYANEFKGKSIVVLVGNDHKYALLELLKNHNLEVKNYYD
ncbi:hypothetical protein EFA69_14935 [Rufibacter immobilis]|uniref:TraB/GumN family protein n=1 Tax=Rufibacter immobilis TaxID=1348778 RepID=A0A3M9MQE5_9BACT|nr:hypothetical protein [Rufibacter immobilis]RNI27427.1 hypothetical protein EFA69_14935 [Rufibacter immobilis]